MTKSGIKNLFSKDGVKNLVDYYLEWKLLDSNGRKNRGGHSMEAIIETVEDFLNVMELPTSRKLTQQKLSLPTV